MAERRSLTASLYWYCRTPEGWRRFPVVIGGSGRIRTGVVMVNGVEQKYPDGYFSLRTYTDGRTVWRNVGTDAGEALQAQGKAAKGMHLSHEAKGTGIRVTLPEAGTKTLLQLRDDFLEEIKLGNGKSSLSTYTLILDLFLEITAKRLPAEIVRIDILRYFRKLRDEGFAEHTIFIRSRGLLKFLKFAKVSPDELPKGKELPDKPKPQVETYTEAEIATLLDGARSKTDALIYEFLWKTGLREREYMFLEWANLDFVDGIVKVRNKPDLGFRIKTQEEREVPLEPELIEKLQQHRKANAGRRFVFGTRNDRPRRHLIRKLKADAWRLGLACGVCEPCRRARECEHWLLHKFRATFATTCLIKGMDLRTLMKLMGHTDIESTMAYLQPARAETTKDMIANFFGSGPAQVITMPKRRRA